MPNGRIGPNEVRITSVYTKEMDQHGGNHDPTPNWHTGRAPVMGGGGASAFHLTIEAEAGVNIGGGPGAYDVYVQAACLTNPAACVPGVGLGNLGDPLAPMIAGETFAAGDWEFQPEGDRYTITWDLNFPPPAGVALGGAGMTLELHQVWQFFVTLIDTATPPAFACTAASPPFFLVG